MSRNLILPFFAVPPTQYDQQYFANLTRSFAVYMEQQQNPGEERATKLTLTDLQTDDSGLENGALMGLTPSHEKGIITTVKQISTI